MQDNTARAVSTIGIWISAAIILTRGVFGANWNGDSGLFVLVAVVLIICAAAGISTAFIWMRYASRRAEGHEKTRGFAVVMLGEKDKST